MSKKLFHSFLMFLLLTLPSLVIGQQDTTVQIKTVDIFAPTIKQEPIAKSVQSWDYDSIRQSGIPNVAELLTKESGVYIKSYGMGSIATSSIRGASASQSIVLWNGMPIQSPMLGQLDLSLLPTFAADNIELQKGGNSANWGSGAIGGVIALNNKPVFEKRLSVWGQNKMGSFASMQQTISLTAGDERFQSQTKFSNQKARNDFSYSENDDGDKRKQTNNRLSQQNFWQDIYWKPKSNVQVAAHFWRQKSFKEIPPNKSQSSSTASQVDKSTRILLQGKVVNDNSTTEAQVGFSKEYLIYTSNNVFDLNSNKSQFSNLSASLGNQWILSPMFRIYLGVTYQYTDAKSGGFQDIGRNENRAAILGSVQMQGKLGLLKLSAEKGVTDDEIIEEKNITPLVPSLSFTTPSEKAIKFKFSVNRNYRYPTLNDRYWEPGGNQEILPESGWSQEAGITVHDENKHSFFNIKLNAFNRNINNWILWTRLEGQNFWSPINLEKVWSRGLEFDLAVNLKLDEVKAGYELGFSYIQSTYQFDLDNPLIEKGDQLIYTPWHQAYAKGQIGWKDFAIHYRHNFTGKTDGINDDIGAFLYADASLRYRFSSGRYKIAAFFNVKNIWDKDYEVIERQPMPGIHYEIGINMGFSKEYTN